MLWTMMSFDKSSEEHCMLYMQLQSAMTCKTKNRACHLGSIVRYSGVVMIGLLYMAYFDGCRHTFKFMPRLRLPHEGACCAALYIHMRRFTNLQIPRESCRRNAQP